MIFVCVASGPSLRPIDLEYMRDRPGVEVIVINDCYRLASWADHLYAADFKWWDHHIDDVRCSFSGKRWSLDQTAKQTKYNYKLNTLPGKDAPGFGTDCLHHGRHSGYQAINLAFILGADRVILLGYDYLKGVDGRTHWFGEHPPGLVQPGQNTLDSFAAAFDSVPDEYRIINCSTRTALTRFPCMPITGVLPSAML